MSAGERYASFDGDADRIVYYYVNTGAVYIRTFVYPQKVSSISMKFGMHVEVDE